MKKVLLWLQFIGLGLFLVIFSQISVARATSYPSGIVTQGEISFSDPAIGSGVSFPGGEVKSSNCAGQEGLENFSAGYFYPVGDSGVIDRLKSDPNFIAAHPDAFTCQSNIRFFGGGDLIVPSTGDSNNETTNTSEKSSNISFSATAKGDKDITIGWTKVDQAHSYKVFRDSTYVGKGDALATRIIDKNVADGSYSYKLVAYDSSGKEIASATQNVTKSGTKVSTAPTTLPGATALSVSSIWLPKAKANSLSELILTIINWLLAGTGGSAVLALIYSGIMYMMAGGETEKTAAAKKNIYWAIIGIIIVLLSAVIVNTVGIILGG